MSAPVIASVVPPALPRSGGRVPSLVRGPLPLPSLVSGRTSAVVYGLAALDDRGRVADRVVMRALGWPASLRLVIDETRGVLQIQPDPSGEHQVTSQGYLRIPAPLRHRCGLTAGDRVLLAADPHRARLTVYPPAALDRALAALTAVGGEPA